MTAIATGTEVKRSGNRAGTCAFDVIFPLIENSSEPNYALASHPKLECWDDSDLDTVTEKFGDDKVFWETSAHEIGSTPDLFVGTVLRAIPTGLSAAGADWALNANQTSGTDFPATGKGRCLKGSEHSLPLLPNSEDFLGDGNALINRIPFNLAAAIHDGTSRTPGDLQCNVAIKYTFLNDDPTCVVRGNTRSDGTEPSSTDIILLDHTHMKSIFGDDPDLISAGGARTLRHADASASNSNPFMDKPTSGYSYCGKIVATGS